MNLSALVSLVCTSFMIIMYAKCLLIVESMALNAYYTTSTVRIT